MASTRVRLTLSYFVVLMGALIAFAYVLMEEHKTDAILQAADQAAAISDSLLATIAATQASQKKLTYVDSIRFGTPMAYATPALADLLDPESGYFLVVGGAGQVLYASTLIRRLPEADRAFLMLQTLTEGEGARVVRVRALSAVESDTMRLVIVARHLQVVGPNVARVIAGVPIDDTDFSARLLGETLLVFAPLLLIVSIAVAYYVAGRGLIDSSAVGLLIGEVAAISDGRSLHRRLPAGSGDDELARLSATLNAMLSRLEHSFAVLRRFTADASHELKTPLAVLRADVERSMHPGTTRDDRLVSLEEAIEEITRMSDLVDSLLTLARADEGRFDLVREPIHLEPLVRDVYETALILGEAAGLEITLPSIEDAVVLGDVERLRHLLLNLVTNAIKYTPSGGRVEIAMTTRAPGDVSIAVRDSGIGIAASDLPHVFDRFWRADLARSRASERGGFGLGLAIAQWIVQAHGGTLAVQSRLGRGTIFTVVLPTDVAEEGADGAVVGAHEPAPGSGASGSVGPVGQSRI